MPETFGANPTALTDPWRRPLEVADGPVGSSLRAAVETSLANLVPDGKRAAVVGVLDPVGRVGHVAVAARIGDHWQLAADVEARWGGTVAGRVMLFGTF